MERFNNFLKQLQTNSPDLKIAFKNQTWWMRILGKIMFFNPRFMTDFTTTLGNTVYFPSSDFFGQVSEKEAMIILAHEFVHISDQAKQGRLKYSLLYAIPQIFILWAPILFLFHWWLACLWICLWAIPFPAYWRMRSEFHGYSMSLFVSNYLLKEMGMDQINRTYALNDLADQLSKEFTSSSYYFMWMFGVNKSLHDQVNLILSNEILKQDDIYEEVAACLAASKV